MTYNEITLFRRFMTNKGVLNNFEYLFEHHRFEQKTIDQYYDDTAADLVIMTAFDFSKCDRTIFNYSYWEKLDQKWQFCLKQFREEGKMENPPELRCAMCGKMKPVSAFNLGKKLVPHKYCRDCEDEIRHKQIEGNKKREQFGVETHPVTKICAHCGKRKPLDEFYVKADAKDGHQAYCKDCMREHGRLRNGTTGEYRQPEGTMTKESKTMEDFTFFDFDKAVNVRDRAIEPGKAAINYKKTGSYLSFGITESTDIINGNLLKMRVRVDNITGAIHFVFNKEQGATAAIRNKKNIVLTNKQLVDFLMQRLHLEAKDGERYIINIGKNLSNTDGFITYNVTR
ncbi:MAG: hypothetical protein J6J71_03315 [Prevotella sp.]|nr:hypothetical protein [Prevotella sp.]